MGIVMRRLILASEFCLLYSVLAMAVKIELTKKKISLGVRDLLAEPLAAGRVAGLSMWTRMALGREAHVNRQNAQAGLYEGYAREIVVRLQNCGR